MKSVNKSSIADKVVGVGQIAQGLATGAAGLVMIPAAQTQGIKNVAGSLIQHGADKFNEGVNKFRGRTQ